MGSMGFLWLMVDLKIRAYNLKANGLVEKGHQPLIYALMTWLDFGRKNWTLVLHIALFAD
ncbi:hypothetical protein RB213_007232 [Colletotrichum asianum]